MASYDEYRKKYVEGGAEDSIDREIDEAKEVAEAREDGPVENAFTMPERFRGKSAEEIAASYAELEKLNSRQAQELGEYRRQNQELVERVINVPNTATEADSPEPSASISFDELLEDTAGTVRKAVSELPEIRELREMSARSRAQEYQAQIKARHPDVEEIVQSPEFQNWVLDDPSLKAAFERADAGDLYSADLLLRAYKNTKEVGKARAVAKREQTLTKVVTESSSSSEPPAPKTYSRSEFFEVMLAAKQGDEKARRYLNVHYPKYRAALAKGNVRD